jgi:hypothetical protein
MLQGMADVAAETWCSEKVGPCEQSLNVRYIEQFALKTSTLLCNIFAPMHKRSKFASGDQAERPSRLMITVQVILAPLILSLRTPEIHAFDFPQSQQIVYSGPRHKPIFRGRGALEVDMLWTLHQINFWKYHMVRREECTLHPAFISLEEWERPQLWSRPTSGCQEHGAPDVHIGRTWKTCFAFIDRDRLFDLRAGIDDNDPTQDEFEYEATHDAFPEWSLRISQGAVDTWPRTFEDCLHSLMPLEGSPRNVTRAHRGPVNDDWIPAFTPQRLMCHESAYNEDDDATDIFHADGWLTALPPQNGIPGFARVTMMKFKIDASGSVREPWAYEGVMLPGRQMIIGRWWEPFVPESQAMSGPFIMWCVDNGRELDDQDTGRMNMD